ncbi:hypothetical protein Q5M85_02875 [Paraclostridium bifermentans]|nr:hypothetical protein [Paraclostridium bifermentans]
MALVFYNCYRRNYTQGAVNAFGSTVVAAHTTASKVEQLVVQPSITFGVTMATYCAQKSRLKYR